MSAFEYRVVPAPRLAPRIKGVREPAERFAIAVEDAINEAAREGWEYWRAETLTMEARAGWLGGRSVGPQALLVFRRLPAEAAQDAPHGPRREAREAAPASAPASSPAPPSFARRPEPFGPRARLAPASAGEPEAGAVTPLPPRPLAARPALPWREAEPPVERPASAEPSARPSRPDRDDPHGRGGPGRPRLGGARRD